MSLEAPAYGIGDRCPECNLHFRELVHQLPTQEEWDDYGMVGFSAKEPIKAVCPNKHEFAAAVEWTRHPHPTPVWAP